MPWRKCHRMDEKRKFLSRFLDGEKIAVPRRAGPSESRGSPATESSTGIGKGGRAFTDRSRRPQSQRPPSTEMSCIRIENSGDSRKAFLP